MYATRDDSKFCFVDLTSSESAEVATELYAPRSGEMGKILELKEGICLFEDKFPWYKKREEDEKFVIESIARRNATYPESILTWTRWLNYELYSTQEMDVDELSDHKKVEDLPAPKPSLLACNPFGTF